MQAVRQFQEDPKTRLFIGNIRAAGEGITLHAASAVLFTELTWVPKEHDQAADRVLRIGQTASSINIYWLVARNTVEEAVIRAHNAKRHVIDQVVDGSPSDDAVSRIIDMFLLGRRL